MKRVLYLSGYTDLYIATDVGWYDGTKPEYNVRKLSGQVALAPVSFADELVSNIMSGGEAYGCGWGGTSHLFPISEAQEKELLDLKMTKTNKIKEKEEKEEFETAKIIIAKAERQSWMPTNEEYEKWARNYNNVNNEGGEGYIPHLITKEQLARAKKIVNAKGDC